MAKRVLVPPRSTLRPTDPNGVVTQELYDLLQQLVLEIKAIKAFVGMPP